MNSLLRSTFCLLALCGFTFSAQAAVSKYALIDGISQELVLEVNPAFEGHSHLYLGHLRDDETSWARVSHIDGKWEGVLVRNEQIHLIHGLADSPRQSTQQSRFTVSALTGQQELGTCGVERAPLFAASPATPLKASAVVDRASTINFSSYCNQRVDGVCLVAELTIIFDDLFVQRFGMNAEAQGVALLNIVEGFYRNQFNIVFNRLNVSFTNGNAFTSSRDAGEILGDMSEKRFANQTGSFDPNPQSLMHLVSGRDFFYTDEDDFVDESVVGLAFGPVYTSQNYPNSFTPVMCTRAAVATSQVVNSSISLTALVVTHEIGHNLGADHDGDSSSVVASSCASTGFIMASSLSAGLTQFSTCSRSTIAANINRLSPVEACFDFPVDVSITAEEDNSTRAEPNLELLNNFAVVLETANGRNGNITATGTITSGDAEFSRVTLPGATCTLSNGNTTYSCRSSTLQNLNTLGVSIIPGQDDFTVTHSIAPDTGTDLFELDTTNNSVSESIDMLAPDVAPTTLSGTFLASTIRLTWLDNSTNEEAFVVQRRSSEEEEWQTLTDTLPARTQIYVDAEIVQGATYYYRVLAVFSGTLSAPTNTVRVTASRLPGQEVLRKKKGGGGSLPLWWLAALAGFAGLRGIQFASRLRTSRS